jgi:transposase InsO family protein
VDFSLVLTLTFRLFFVFVVLRHDRRELIHFNITDHPTALWTARQIIEAFPDDTAPRYLLRDRDGTYGDEFARRVQRLGIREVLTAPRAPWQNPLVERLIGSIRRECLDHVIILNEAHLRRPLNSYIAYYNTTRPPSSARQSLSTATRGGAASARAGGGHPAGRRAPSPLHPRRLNMVSGRASPRPLCDPPRCSLEWASALPSSAALPAAIPITHSRVHRFAPIVG